MMEHHVLSDDGLIASDKGFALDIRLPWYRALPLSVVSVDEVRLDGEPIDRARITFNLNGKTLSVDGLRPRTSEWWYVLDSAILNVEGRRVAPGETHEVSVAVSVRPPYMGGLGLSSRASKVLVAR